MRKHRVALAALVAFVIIGVSCGSSSDDDAGGSTGSDGSGTSTPANGASDGEVCTADRVGGEVTMGMYTESKGLDPIVQFGSGVAGGTETAAIFDRLMTWNPVSGAFTPRLAKSLEPDATFTVWTLGLRPEAKFGNGDPVDAAAVKFSIERTMSDANKTQSKAAAATAIKSVEVVDPLTVKLTLSYEWPAFPGLLADETGMIVNPKVVQSMTPEAFNKMPAGAGAGAYEPVSFVPGEDIVLEAKDDWWGGPVCVQKLRFIWIQGGQGTYDAFNNDELNVALLREPRIIQEAKDDGVNMFESFQNLGDVLYLNNDAGHITADVRIRQAISRAIDVAAVDMRVNEGTGIPTSGMVGEGSLFYDPAVVGPTYDLAAAKALVEEVKSETGWDGSIDLLCDNIPTRVEQALAVEAMLNAAGFKTNTNSTLNVTDLIQVTRVDRTFDIACGGLSVNDAAPWLRLNPKIGAGNVGESRYESAEMNALVDELRLAETVDEQKAVLADMQVVWNRDVPLQNLFTVVEAIIWSDQVHALEFTAKTVVFFDKAFIEA
jgi:peptide/nickel transport system substrate-binding protein